MKRFLFTLLALSISVSGIFAQKQEIRNLDITLHLTDKGSVTFDEYWDINTGPNITEWYLVRENLGDIIIPKLTVLDGETGERFEDVGEWDVNRSLEEKAGKSGIVHKDNGVELCWGIAPRGDRKFYAFYSMIKAMKSLNDYDMLHLQVVSPGMSNPPKHVRITVKSNDFQLDTTNTRAWGFGFEGTTTFTDSTVVFESSKPFRTDDSAIILLRFNKGMFQPLSVQERDFQEALDIALEGSKFADDPKEENPFTGAMAGLMIVLLLFFAFVRPIIKIFKGSRTKVTNRDKKKLLGVAPDKVDWYRDIPMDGDLQMADYVLRRLGERGSANNLPLAEILRMIYKGNLAVTSELNGPVNISFARRDGLSEVSKDFYNMLKEASGSDSILQDKEFSQWASRHESRVYQWSETSRTDGLAKFRAKRYLRNDKFSSEGQAEARKVMGLRKFLNDFTLLNQHETIEANLWKEYMVYAALFGIADKVARQLKDIDPKFFEKTFSYDYRTFSSVLSSSQSISRALGNAIVSAQRPVYYSSGGSSSSSSYSGRSRSGGGGYTSRSGGRGYSGGGRGGGGR